MAATGDLLGDLLGEDTLLQPAAAAEQPSTQQSRDAAVSLLDDMGLDIMGSATCTASEPPKYLEQQQQQQQALKQAACSPAHLLQLSQQLSSISAQGSSQRLHRLLVLVLEQYEAAQQQLAPGSDGRQAATTTTTTSSSRDDVNAAQLQQQLAAALQEVGVLRAAQQEAADRQHQVGGAGNGTNAEMLRCLADCVCAAFHSMTCVLHQSLNARPHLGRSDHRWSPLIAIVHAMRSVCTVQQHW
jgi:hypothetical protein